MSDGRLDPGLARFERRAREAAAGPVRLPPEWRGEMVRNAVGLAPAPARARGGRSRVVRGALAGALAACWVTIGALRATTPGVGVGGGAAVAEAAGGDGGGTPGRGARLLVGYVAAQGELRRELLVLR